MDAEAKILGLRSKNNAEKGVDTELKQLQEEYRS